MDEDQDEWEVERILDHRGDGAYRRYLIKWKDSEENSWLPPGSLAKCQDVFRAYLRSKGLKDELRALDARGKSKT